MVLKQESIRNNIGAMFKEFGLLSAPYDLENILPNQEFINEILKFDMDSANILKFSPDFFIMPSHIKGSTEEKIEIAKKQTFFLKILTKLKLSKKELEVYKKYYKYNNLVLICLNSKERILQLSRLSELTLDDDEEEVLITFPKDATINFWLNISSDLEKNKAEEILEKYNKLLFV